MTRGAIVARALLAGLAGYSMAGVACSDSGDAPSNEPGGVCPEGGGAVEGPADTHCIDADGTEVIQSVGACATGVQAGSAPDNEATAEEEEYVTSYGSESDDDDCKYRVSFSSTCIAVNRPVTFTLTLNRKQDGSPATGGEPRFPEFFMPEDGHLSPSNRISAPEVSPGTYEIGPILFDRPGRWVARFHFFERCSDVPDDSPHGHASYYIDVP